MEESGGHSNGTRLAEYEVFIEYYNKLITSLKNYGTLRLFKNCVHQSDYVMIRKCIYKVSISRTEFNKDAINNGLLLAIIAIKLYYYNTESFYKILEFMQSNKEDPGVQQLATEILTKVNEFDPVKSSGSQLLEFDVFMKYYNWVTENVLNIYESTNATEVITEDDRYFIMSYGCRSSYNIIVIKTINHLLCGDASYFYDLLEDMRHRASKIASKIQTEIHLWNRKMSTGSDCPLLDDLHKIVTPGFAAQWKYIGNRLNFTLTSLEAIHDGNHGDNIKCCDALLSKWLDADPQATLEKLISAIDTRSAEYIVFIQYYDKLIPSLKNCTDQLYRICYRSFNFQIKDYVDEVINEDATKAGVWLAIIAMKLYYDNTESFYDMLEFMKSSKEDPGVQQLAAEIHTKVEEFDPLMLSGSLPIEFDMLMKYYNHLTELLWNKFDYSFFVKAEIITEKEKDYILSNEILSDERRIRFKIILIKTLNYILSGDANLFYKLLNNLHYIPNGDKVTLRMQAEIKLFTVVEKCPISECKLLSKTFDHNGGELIIEEHDVTIAVPKLAVFEGVKVEIQAVASLTGPYKLPDDCDLVSVFVWIGANYRFKKPVKVTVPHFAYIEGLDHRMVILTANEKDIVHKEDGNYVVQMHESVYDYQYEVNSDCFVYYTNHFCSKCYVERSFIYKLYNTLVLSPLESLFSFRRRVMVFFCYPKDYATADELKVELCICYSLKYCLQTVCERYEHKNVILKKVPWNITISKRKCQNFCISYNECPSWKIQLLGKEKLNVKDLNFWNYSIGNLREEEKLCTYPPQFEVTVQYLKEHSKNLDIKFEIALETDGVLASDDALKFPLPVIIKSAKEDQQCATNVGSALTTNNTITAPTFTNNATCTLTADDISNHQLSADVSSTLISTTTATATTITIATSTSSTSDISSLGASMTDRPEVRYLNLYVRDSLCGACATGPNKWFGVGLTLIGESGRNNLNVIKRDHKDDTYGCCDAMFTLWLQRDPEASWSKLITALNENSLETAASDLTNRLRQ